jgi:DNA uptake protein ComE-like DNA-binding protein
MTFAMLALTFGATLASAQGKAKPKPTTTAATAQAGKATLVDLNTATKQELMAIPGIGGAPRHRSPVSSLTPTSLMDGFGPPT